MSDIDIESKAQEIRDKAGQEFKASRWPDQETMNHLFDDVIKDRDTFNKVIAAMEKGNAADRSGLTVRDTKNPKGEIACIDFVYFERHKDEKGRIKPMRTESLVCPAVEASETKPGKSK